MPAPPKNHDRDHLEKKVRDKTDLPPNFDPTPITSHQQHPPSTMMRFQRLLNITFALLVIFVTLLCRQPCLAAEDPLIIEDDHPLLQNDPQLLMAMETFMAMSAQEREDTIQKLLDAVQDDPKAVAEMELLISKLPALEKEQVSSKSNLKELVHDDELAKARQDAKQQMGGTSWEFFLENQEVILEATIAGGQLRPEDVALFKSDKSAWLKQLRLIWEDATGGGGGEL
ncbi:MAG: hypothetical protein SGARI_001608 [Bacillariaceae sp.]